MSPSVIPCVVIAGVPTRMPEPMHRLAAGRRGIAFLFKVMRGRVAAHLGVAPGRLVQVPEVEQREMGVGAAGDRSHAFAPPARQRAPAHW